MSLVIVVVAFRDPAALDGCLRSIERRHGRKVLVVNVTGDSGVSAVVDAHAAEELVIDGNVGYAAAVNAAVRALDPSFDAIFFMNDDVQLLSALPTEPVVGVRVPQQRSAAGASLPVVQCLPTPVGFLRAWVLGRHGPPVAPGRPLPPGTFANGAAIVAPRAVLEMVPLPSEYFLYWEETAWFWRLADAGVPTFMDDVVVERPPGASEFSERKAALLGENLIRLAVERYGPLGRFAYAALGLGWVLRLSLTDCVRVDRWMRWKHRARTAQGIVRAVAGRSSTTVHPDG